MTESETRDIDPTPDSTEPAADAAPGGPRRILFGVLAALAFLVPAGAGIAVGVTLLTSSGSADAAPTPTTTATSTPTPTVAALPPYDFSSPSGNLRCHIDAESAYCHQGDFTYAVPASNCAAGGVAVGVTTEGTYWPCLSARPAESPAIAYDVPVHHGEFTCDINYVFGVRCVNAAGSGFTMEYDAGVRTF